MISTEINVDDAHDSPNLDLLMQNAITGYLRARDQYLQSMDAIDAFVYTTDVLYAAFAESIGIADRGILCITFQAFRRELIRQHDANQATVHITDYQ